MEEMGIIMPCCCCPVPELCLTLRPHGLQDARPPCPHRLPKFAQVHVHCIGDVIQHLILCHPLLLLPSIFPSIRDFSSESVLHIR